MKILNPKNQIPRTKFQPLTFRIGFFCWFLEFGFWKLVLPLGGIE